MELIIRFFEFENSLLELYMMHIEISFDMIEIRMDNLIILEYICDILQSLVIFILYLQYSHL
jgi:hypothetical protein